MKRSFAVGTVGLGLGMTLAVLAGCGSKAVGLGGHDETQGDGGGGDPGAGGGSGSDGGSPGDGGAIGSGGTGQNPEAGPDDEVYPGGPAYPGGPDLPAVIGRKHSKKLDLLLVVDNSISMADKQAALTRTIPDLVGHLTDGALGVDDLHVGVITSSLGGHGASLCDSSTNPVKAEQENDHAHLVGTRPRAGAVDAPGGFVSWQRGASSTASLATNVQGLVEAAGEFGCGFEATLEAAYRFLVDPSPPLSIELQPCSGSNSNPCAVPTGLDTDLLAQRGAFLRPDSVVAVVVLSDENDCSIRDAQQYYFAASKDFSLKQGSSACATNPNDLCCYSCLTSPPAGCAADPACGTESGTDKEINLRCFDQKRRFGLDFLYPTDRYVNAFSRPWICAGQADLALANCPAEGIVENPLFQSGAGNRGTSMVYVANLIGVPPGEIEGAGKVDFDAVLGDPGASPPVSPSDALMIEATSPRGGNGPGGESLQPPNAGLLANSQNGHEWTNGSQDDLQYACIFALPQTKDCAAIATGTADPKPGCDCTASAVDGQNPLCQAEDGSYGGVQRFAKAYPSTRQLSVAKGLGARSVVGSICAANLTDPAAADFGYRGMVNALTSTIEASVE